MTDIHSPDAAYGAAYRDLVDLLVKVGAEHPHDLARDYLTDLQQAGWQWRRRVIPPPRPRHGSPPSTTYLQAKEALLEALHTEAMAADQNTEPEGAEA